MTESKVRNTLTGNYIIMNSKLSMIGIYGVLMIGIIFIVPQSNTDSKVFAQAGTAGNNQSATSKVAFNGSLQKTKTRSNRILARL